MAKTNPGRFFEDFQVGAELVHAVPRTITEGDQALYVALTGDRYPLHCSAEYARSLGYRRETVNDLLVFHVVFGKTVTDVSLNAVANLGYAGLRFLAPVYPGDTLRAVSKVVGKKENSSGETGIVWVRTTGVNQRGEVVLEYYRWVMVNKRDPKSAADPADTAKKSAADPADTAKKSAADPADTAKKSAADPADATTKSAADPADATKKSAAPKGEEVVPELPKEVRASELVVPEALSLKAYERWPSGGASYFDDYEIGERIDHVDGMTIEESDHMLATRLYQNTAKVHFDAHAMKDSRFGKRLIYGGHVISLCRALSFNGLENTLGVLAFNGGQHVSPTFAGDTLYAWTEILDKQRIGGRDDVGALRVRLVGVKNVAPTTDIPRMIEKDGKPRHHPSVVLDLDLWLAMPLV